MRTLVRAPGIIGVILLLVLPGCSGDGAKPLKNIVPVSGTVTFDGKPLEQGIVSFAPVDPTGQSATGQITSGSFTMMTTVSAPGVIAGKYKVIVEAVKPLTGPPSNNPAELYPKPQSLIPVKYNKITTSGLEVDVVKGMPAPKFELKS